MTLTFEDQEQKMMIQKDREAREKAKALLGCPELPFHPFQAALFAFNDCYPGSGLKGWQDLREMNITRSGSRLPYYRKLEEICRRAFRRQSLSKDQLKAVAFGIHYFELLVELIVSDNDKAV